MATAYVTHEELHAVRDELKGDIRGVGALVERLESKIEILAEGMVAMRDGWRTELRSTEERLSERMTIIEEVVRQNSTDIRENREAIRENREAIEVNRVAIRENADGIGELRAKVTDLQADVADLKRRS
jgi:methyl-accepting chemotaxis protein